MASTTEAGRPTAAVRRGLPWHLYGVANIAVVLVLSLLFWYLLTDPKTSPFKTYPYPFNAVLFWAILVTVFLGFNLQLHGFTKYPQPYRGILLIAITVVVSIGVVALVTRGWGAWDPSFAYNRAADLGYLMTALFVLIGFFTYVTVAVNWGLWPWAQLGLKQPWLGIGAILFMTPLTILGYAVLVLPSLAVWAKPGNVFLDLNTTIGWFYDVIVAAVLTGVVWENWPWRLAKSGGLVAIGSLIGNLALGTGLYFVSLALLHILISGSTITTLGVGLNSYTADLGVCWVFWMIAWANVFGNRPLAGSLATRYLARLVITFVLGVATFLLYYYVLAGSVLGEPVAAGSLYGNALGWMDWMVLWLLFYVVYLSSYGLRLRDAATNSG